LTTKDGIVPPLYKIQAPLPDSLQLEREEMFVFVLFLNAFIPLLMNDMSLKKRGKKSVRKTSLKENGD